MLNKIKSYKKLLGGFILTGALMLGASATFASTPQDRGDHGRQSNDQARQYNGNGSTRGGRVTENRFTQYNRDSRDRDDHNGYQVRGYDRDDFRPVVRSFSQPLFQFSFGQTRGRVFNGFNGNDCNRR